MKKKKKQQEKLWKSFFDEVKIQKENRKLSQIGWNEKTPQI
jgi:hypothetical protein